MSRPPERSEWNFGMLKKVILHSLSGYHPELERQSRSQTTRLRPGAVAFLAYGRVFESNGLTSGSS